MALLTALKGPDVNLRTAEAARAILEAAEGPVSRNWILGRLKEEGHTTTRPRLNRVLRFYSGLGLLVEGSKGIQWTHNESEGLRRARATGRRV